MSTAYQKALKLLGAREYCRAQLKLKLASFDEQAVEQALDQLAREGSLCDRRFAEAYVRQRIAGGFGPEKVRYQLLQKGVAAELADSVIGLSEWNWSEVAQTVAARNWQVQAEGASFQAVAESVRNTLLLKVSRFLKQRGFTYDQIELARQFLKDASPT